MAVVSYFSCDSVQESAVGDITVEPVDCLGEVHVVWRRLDEPEVLTLHLLVHRLRERA